MNKDIVTSKTFLAYSLGCRTNQAEMETITKKLQKAGFVPASSSSRFPAVVILNTCVVTTKAEKETRKEIRKLRRLFPESLLVVTGCAIDAQKKIKISLPKADLVIPNSEKDRIPKLLGELFSPGKNNEQDNTTANKYLLSGRKFIKIQEGCHQFCTFCLTAYLRGKPKSIALKTIIQEIRDAEQQGIKEIILTGTNIALFGQDLKEKTSLTSLVREILGKTDIERITFSSIYPEMIDREFLDLVINTPRISRFFHLALQSGSTTVLKRMNRPVNIKHLVKSAGHLKRFLPEFTLRADIITGFPGESDQEHQETIDLIKQLDISFVHLFPFSKREGTLAFKMKDLPEETKKKRAEEITQLVLGIRKKEAKKQINKTSQTLIVRKNKAGFEGLTGNGWPIQIKVNKPKLTEHMIKGKILPVKITGYNNDQLLGEILSLPT